MDNYEYCLEMANAAGMTFKGYPQTKLINVTDEDGIIQSYYASTGTAVFRDGNNKYKSRKHTEHNISFERFLTLCKGEEDILTVFFD